MRFDAYAGNVWGGRSASEVAEVVAISVKARVERGRPRGRYTDVFDLKDAGHPVGWVARDASLDSAYFEFKGETTPQVATAIREHWAATHTVSRLDACEDFDAPGCFEYLTRVLDAAKDPRVQSKAITPRDGDRGETIYWGSPQSRVMVRCYEAGKMKDRMHFGRPDWARAEAQIRPGKAAEKKLAASVTALDAWGFAAWSRKAAEVLSQVEVQRFAPEHVAPTFDRTTLYLARTFRRHLEEMLADFGSRDCIVREFEAVWTEDDRARAEFDRLKQAR